MDEDRHATRQANMKGVVGQEREEDVSQVCGGGQGGQHSSTEHQS